MIGPTFVYVTRYGEREPDPGLYYLHKTDHSHGVAQKEYVEKSCSPEDRERIINGSFFESHEALMKHIDYVNETEYLNKKERDMFGEDEEDAGSQPYQIELAPTKAEQAVEELVKL